MRILQVLSDNTLLCGISRHVLNISSNMVLKHGCDVAIATVFPHGDLSKAFSIVGGKCFSLNLRNHNSFNVFLNFRKLIRNYRPDVVHLHVLVFWECMYLWLFGGNIKVVRTIHSENQALSFIKRLMWGLCRLKFDETYFISKAVADYYYKKCGIVGKVIYNPVSVLDLDHRSRLHDVLRLSANEKVIGTSCRIGKVKRPDWFASVMCRVLQLHPNVHAVVIGNGDKVLISQIQDIVHQHGVDGRFHLLGFREDAQVLTSGLDVYVMTSELEGMPTAFLEAVGAGVPAVFMNGRGGLKDLSDLNQSSYGPFGVCVSVGAISEMTRAINRLLKDPSFHCALSKNCIRMSKELFSVDKITDQLISSYQTILKENRK